MKIKYGSKNNLASTYNNKIVYIQTNVLRISDPLGGFTSNDSIEGILMGASENNSITYKAFPHIYDGYPDYWYMSRSFPGGSGYPFYAYVWIDFNEVKKIWKLEYIMSGNPATFFPASPTYTVYIDDVYPISNNNVDTLYNISCTKLKFEIYYPTYGLQSASVRDVNIYMYE